MHLIALVESPGHVCCRYRLEAFRPALERAGHRLQVQALPPHWWQRLRLSGELRQADVVILQRKLLPAWQAALLARASSRLLFDLDDAVFLRDSYAGKPQQSVRRQRRFAAIVRRADLVVAGNSFLAAAALDAGAARAVVVPTCVDPQRYPCAVHERTGAGTQLVWIGSSSTLHGLEQVRPLLESVGLSLPGLYLKLICDRFLELNALAALPCPWSEATEASELAAADIGISWLPDDAWSRGKCGLKVLQYMAAGLPVVANPVGVQRELIRHGGNGLPRDHARRMDPGHRATGL